MNNLSEVLSKFVNACIKAEEAQESGNSKIYNKQQRIIDEVRIELKKNTDLGLECLIQFLEHENRLVQLEAAISIIPINPQKAEETLAKLSSERGTTAFNAKMTLQEWKKGKLNLS